jgi:hypothetical protein
MDLLKNKLSWDIRTLISDPYLFYGKIAALAVGAFIIGRISK